MKNLKNVFREYEDIYRQILHHLYPATGSNGFTERNQTVNFTNAYKKAYNHNDCVVWYEFSFGQNNHYDAVLFDTTDKEIYVIEAKRYKGREKSAAISNDIERINRFYDEMLGECGERIRDFAKYKKIYGIILADVWTIKNNQEHSKNKMYEAFRRGDYFEERRETVRNCEYLCSEVDKCVYSTEAEDYHLAAFRWTVNEQE